MIPGATRIDNLFGLQEAFGVGQVQVSWLPVRGVGILGSFYPLLGGLKAVAVSDTIIGIGLPLQAC